MRDFTISDELQHSVVKQEIELALTILRFHVSVHLNDILKRVLALNYYKVVYI